MFIVSITSLLEFDTHLNPFRPSLYGDLCLSLRFVIPTKYSGAICSLPVSPLPPLFPRVPPEYLGGKYVCMHARFTCLADTWHLRSEPLLSLSRPPHTNMATPRLAGLSEQTMVEKNMQTSGDIPLVSDISPLDLNFSLSLLNPSTHKSTQYSVSRLPVTSAAVQYDLSLSPHLFPPGIMNNLTVAYSTHLVRSIRSSAVPLTNWT